MKTQIFVILCLINISISTDKIALELKTASKWIVPKIGSVVEGCKGYLQ